MRDDRRIAAFERHKLPPVTEKPSRRLGHAVSIGVAAASFLISIFSFYNSSLRQVDELSVIFSDNGRIRHGNPDREDSRGLSVLGGGELVFINGGTRSIAILGVSIVGYSTKQPKRTIEAVKGCDHSGLQSEFASETTVNVFVVEPDKVKRVNMRYRSHRAREISETIVVDVDEELQILMTCATVEYATPDGSDSKEVFIHLFKREGYTEQEEGARLLAVGRAKSAIPIVAKRRTTIRWINQLLDKQQSSEPTSQSIPSSSPQSLTSGKSD